MKATDLMIGDWVYNTHNRQNERVEEIGSGLVMLSYNDLYEYDEIEPIPLTKEILEKNGFTNANYTPDSHSKKRYSTLADSRGFWVEVCIESYFEGEVKYVHELQHVLRLCEREKEIEL